MGLKTSQGRRVRLAAFIASGQESWELLSENVSVAQAACAAGGADKPNGADAFVLADELLSSEVDVERRAP